jgi:hypothetical protein
MNKKLIFAIAGCVLLGIASSACGGETRVTEQSIPPATTQTQPVETSATAEVFIDSTETAGGFPDIPDKETIEPDKNIKDEDDGPVHIYAFNEDLRTQIDTFYMQDHPDFRYDYQTVSFEDYEKRLDAVFASTDQMPDVIMLDASFANQYTSSPNLLGIERLGISYEELSNQYSFSRQYMTDSDGSIKALAWQLKPVGLFYNRSVAKAYLGTSDIKKVGEYFLTWSDFLETARTVNEKSGGTVKVVADTEAIFRGYMFSRQNPWIQDGAVSWDPYSEFFLDFYKAIIGEGLTFNETRGSEEWFAHSTDQTVLAYLMTYEDFSSKMGFIVPEKDKEPDPAANPTTGDWSLCEAPADFFLDGTWLAATSDNDKKASTADLFRFFTVSKSSLKTLSDAQLFVNNMPLMEKKAKADSNNDPFLNGQNAYSVLSKSGSEMNVSFITERDEVIEAVFYSITRAYAGGAIPDKAEAAEIFLTDCEDLELAKE